MTSIEPKAEQHDTGRAVLLAAVASARGLLPGKLADPESGRPARWMR